MSHHTKETAYDVVLQQLDSVAKIMNMSDEIVRVLQKPQRLMEVSFPVRMDNGDVKTFQGFRSQHNRALGPTRGGTRLHHEETIDDVKALSFWMTIKNSLAGIPSGGGKGGIVVDPAAHSAGELERICRGYIQAIYPMLGHDVDVFGPDVGATQQVMTWFMDEYERLLHEHRNSSFTGKPLLLGGSQGRAQSTGFGLVCSAGEFLRRENKSLEGMNVAIQGFGNLGSHAALNFAKRGAKVVALTDVFGGIYNSKGIDVAAALEHLKATGSIKGLAGCDAMTNDELLAVKCDILVPAAMQNQLTEDNAGKVQATYVVEGANGPTTPGGEKIMLDRGIKLLPDIVANCGGVVTSYFENVQNRYCFYWPETEVLERLGTLMVQTCANVCTVAEGKKIPMRVAAWVMALDRVIEAMRLRGWVK